MTYRRPIRYCSCRRRGCNHECASWHKDDHLLTHRSPHTTAVAIPWQYPVGPSVFLCPCPTIAMNNSWKIFVWFISVLLLASVLHAEECEAKKSWADIAASTTSSPSPSSTIVDHNDIPKPTASSKIETKSLSSSSPSLSWSQGFVADIRKEEIGFC